MENTIKLFQCLECPSKKYKTERGLKRHKNIIHTDKIILKNYRCHICNITFKNKSNYILHIEIYHEGRNQELAICNECGKQFKNKGQLSVHLLSKCGTIRRFKCTECNKLLMTQGALYHHKLRHTNDKVHMCRYCAKTFYQSGQLIVHERKHTKEKAFICEICNKGFSHRQSLITHNTIHTGVKPFKCESCAREFSCIGNLIKHRKTHLLTCGQRPLTSHRIYNIDTKIKLQANTPSNIKLKDKKKKDILLSLLNNNKSNIKIIKQAQSISKSEIHINNKWSLQQIVNESYNDLDQICIKTDNIHHNDEQLSTEPSYIDDQHQLKLIKNEIDEHLIEENSIHIKDELFEYHDDNDNNELSNNDDNIDNELLSSNDDNKNIEENINNNEQINNIKNEIEPNISDNDNDDKYSINLYTRLLNEKLSTKLNNTRKLENFMKCEYCERIYKNNSVWFKRHLKWHKEHHEQSDASKEKHDLSNNYKCGCCKEIFMNKVDKLEHLKEKHMDKLYCKICNKMFATTNGYRIHNKHYHLGIKRKEYVYICDKCGKRFKSIVHLNNHFNINKCNDANKHFKCTVCLKLFKNKYSRKIHFQKKHNTSNQSTFQCHYCVKTFLYKGQLKIHERQHTGEKPYKCQFCHKSFSYRESLITHNSIHTGIKPHVCIACGSRFSCIGNLIKHKKTHLLTCGSNVINNINPIDILKTRPKGNHVNMLGVHIVQKIT